MSTLTRITLGRLQLNQGVRLPAAGLIDVSVGVPVAALVANPPLTALVQQGLAISVVESIIETNIQSSLVVETEAIQVEVDIC